jgi:hypothetical protein
MSELDDKSLMLGDHGARIAALEKGMTDANAKLDRLIGALDRSKGSWKTLMVFGSLIVGLVEIIEAVKGIFHFKVGG